MGGIWTDRQTWTEKQTCPEGSWCEDTWGEGSPWLEWCTSPSRTMRNTKDRWQATRGEEGLPPELSKRAGSCQRPDFGTVSLQNCETIKFCCFKTQSWVLCYVSPRKLVVQSPSHARLFVTPWTAARQASLSLTHHLPGFAQIHICCIGDAVQPSHPLPLSSSAFNLSQH